MPGIIVVNQENPPNLHKKNLALAASAMGGFSGGIDPSLIQSIIFQKQTIESAVSSSDIFEREYTILTHYNQPRQTGRHGILSSGNAVLNIGNDRSSMLLIVPRFSRFPASVQWLTEHNFRSAVSFNRYRICCTFF